MVRWSHRWQECCARAQAIFQKEGLIPEVGGARTADQLQRNGSDLSAKLFDGNLIPGV